MYVDLIIDINTGLLQLSNANNVKCQQCQMSLMSNVNNVKCQQCQLSTMSNVNNVKCQSNFQNVNQIVTMSIKLSKCHSNCKNVIQIVNMSIKLSNVTISNVMCYQSV